MAGRRTRAALASVVLGVTLAGTSWWAATPALAGEQPVDFTFDLSEHLRRFEEHGIDSRVVGNAGTLIFDDRGRVVGGRARVSVVQMFESFVIESTSTYKFRADGKVEHTTTVVETDPEGNRREDEIEHPVNDYFVSPSSGTGEVVVDAEGTVFPITFEPLSASPQDSPEGETGDAPSAGLDEDGDGFPVAPVLIGVGIAVGVGVGGAMVMRRRRGGGPLVSAGDGWVSGGDGWVSAGQGWRRGHLPEVDVGYGTTTGPPVMTPPSGCDWSLHLRTGAATTDALREAEAHECCRYVITITTDVQHSGRLVKGDQSGAGGNRKRIARAVRTALGITVSGEAAARSGPDATLDDVAGLGDGAIEDPGGDPRPQRHTFEEEPDVAAHADHGEQTRIRIDHDGRCDHTPRYAWSAQAIASGNAEQECTNQAFDPACPVELSGILQGRIEIRGDVAAKAVLAEGGTPDDLDGDIEVVNPQHDHRDRDRMHGEWRGSDQKTSVVTKHLTDTTVETDLVLDAGMIVPSRVTEATGRVTAYVTARLSPSVTLDVAPDRTCGPGCRCGHTPCACACSFRLEMGAAAKVHVDGKTIVLKRPPIVAPGGLEYWTRH